MSFAEIANRPKQQQLCTVGKIIASLDNTEADHLRGMLAADNKTWPNTGPNSIQSAIKEEGFGNVTDKTIRAHRAGTCRCYRDA